MNNNFIQHLLAIKEKYLKTGDIVKSNLNGEYSEVVAWLHKDNNEEITFLEIVNEDNEILTVSDSHVIFKNKTNNNETFAGNDQHLSKILTEY